MSNKYTLNFLAVAFYYSKKLQLTPISFSLRNNQQWVVSCNSGSKRAKYLWFLTLFVSLVITTKELYLSLYCTKKKKIINILHHFFQLLVKAATVSLIFFYNIKSAEITCFFNCICKRYLHRDLKHVQRNFLRNKRSSDWNILQVLAIFIAISIFIVFLLILPLASMSIPKLHEALFIRFLFQSYNSYIFKAYVFTIQLVCFLPTSVLAPIGTTLSFVALGEINLALRNLW